MKLYEWLLISFLIIFSFADTGCASFNRKLKSMLGGNKPSPEQPMVASRETKFSESSDIPPRVKRQYKRTTKESLAEESALDSRAGSLWVMEGQGAYLFSQNVVRLVGDPLAIQLDGDPKDQLQSKADVIRKLINKIEERQRLRLRAPASTEEAQNEPGKTAEKDKKQKTAASPPQAAPPETPADLSVKVVPTRIVERTLEGNYRVKGSQPFLIGSREYKIIVTGIVRAEDFNEDGISATKLLDPKFDIVSARKTEMQ